MITRLPNEDFGGLLQNSYRGGRTQEEALHVQNSAKLIEASKLDVWSIEGMCSEISTETETIFRLPCQKFCKMIPFKFLIPRFFSVTRWSRIWTPDGLLN